MQGQIFTLQNATAFGASNLLGRMLETQGYNAVWMWFTPTGSYDGTVNFEISPDGGVTWFPTQAFALDARTSLITTLASPGAVKSYILPIPGIAQIRARMSGGTQGALTAKCRLTEMVITQ